MIGQVVIFTLGDWTGGHYMKINRYSNEMTRDDLCVITRINDCYIRVLVTIN